MDRSFPQPERLRLALTGVCALLLGSLLILAFGGDDGPARPRPVASFSSPALQPRFSADRHYYVARCDGGRLRLRVHAGQGTKVRVASAGPRSGTFTARPATAPGNDFRVTAGRRGHEEAWKIRCLPADFPELGYERLRESPPGMFSIALPPGRKSPRPWVIVLDNMGVPRWWYSPQTRALWSQVLEDGTVAWPRSFGDGYGVNPNTAFEIRTLSGDLVRNLKTRATVTDGHEFLELPGGNVLVDSYRPGPHLDLSSQAGPADAWAVFGEVQEIDPRGRVVWRWNSRHHVTREETGRWWKNVLSNPHPGPGGADTYDVFHINSIEPRGKDELVVSSRHTDAVYGISRSDGEVLWKLGGVPTERSLRVVGDPARLLFGGQHDARVGEDGILSVYDNAKDRPRPPRVARYRLDIEAGTATFIDQLTDPEVESSHCCGSARELPGGGWLVSWGDNPLLTQFDARGRIAFRLHMPASSFRAVPVPAGAVTPAGLDRGLEHQEATP